MRKAEGEGAKIATSYVVANFHLLKDLQLHAAIICQFTTSGLAQPLGSKVKSHYILWA